MRLSFGQSLRALIATLAFFASLPAMAQNAVELPRVEALPDVYQARLEQRERAAARQPREVGGNRYYLVIEVLSLWPGGVATVAFQGGTPALHAAIEKEASEWSKHGGIRFDFGRDASGRYRQWSPSDQSYAADIRVSFNHPGFWSLVGTNSIDPQIVTPGEASLNLGGFQAPLNADQRGTVIHEFGHALGFHHEHQTPQGGCDAEFRWEDDADGTPGIYSMLGSDPYYWPKAKVDHNLRQLPPSTAYRTTAHDSLSIMHYSFPAWMFIRGDQSQCFTPRNNAISAVDAQGVATGYPRPDTAAFDRSQATQATAAREILSIPNLPSESKEVLEKRLERISE